MFMMHSRITRYSTVSTQSSEFRPNADGLLWKIILERLDSATTNITTQCTSFLACTYKVTRQGHRTKLLHCEPERVIYVS